MSFRIPVSTQEPIRVSTSRRTVLRRLLCNRNVLAGNYQNYTRPVPSGKLWRVLGVYVQVDTSAGGATVRNVNVGFWSPERTIFGTATNMLTYASTEFTDNDSHLICFSPCSTHPMRGATANYRTENIGIPDVELRQGDWVRTDVFECTAGDVVTQVLTVLEYDDV